MTADLNAVAQLGVGGIFAVLMVREVLTWVGRKKQNGPDCTAYTLLSAIHVQNATLEAQNATLEAQSKALSRLVETAEDTNRTVRRVENQVDRRSSK